MSERPTRQEDVEDVILEILEDNRVWTTAEITKAVKVRIPLVAADRQRAAKRESETKVDQIIANALQARRRLARDGLLERTGKGEFRITMIGKDYLSGQRASIASMTSMLDEILGDEEPSQ